MTDLKQDRQAQADEADERWDGAQLKDAMQAASLWLDRHEANINALNVFPVPDGDTGTNMTLTLKAACRQAADTAGKSVTEVTAKMSHGALMGARGNSGVIFSQVLRGFHRGLDDSEKLGASEWAAAMREAATSAHQAVLKPVEGTMLTVIREMAEAAEAASAKGAGLLDAMAATVEAGRASVARTPALLQKLRDAGVVDAGGQGLFVIFEGMLRYARGESVEGPELGATGGVLDMAPEGVHVAHGEYGYCTNFILMGKGLDFPAIREWIAGKGDSVVIVGDEAAIKVHIHTENPGEVLSYVTPLGSLRQVAITDMQEQHEDFLEMHEQAGTGEVVSGVAEAPPEALAGQIATLAVVCGKGMAQAFRSMGATGLVEGGQTMNPSTEDLLRAVEKLPQQEVIILPNNANIIMAAKQTQALSDKRVAVVPTETLPQGMAALVALNYGDDLDANVAAMTQAAEAVETGEVTTAVRDSKMNGMEIKQGDVIGLHNGTLVLTGSTNEEVGRKLLDMMHAGERELITLYYGQDLAAKQAEAFAAGLREAYPEQVIEVVEGGQPFYAYIISAE
ncbi:MAG: DAK2 domain-containing protein [Chloroflexia bacterium]